MGNVGNGTYYHIIIVALTLHVPKILHWKLTFSITSLSWCPFSRECLLVSTQTLYYQKRWLHFTSDIWGLSLFKLTCLASEATGTTCTDAKP